MRRTDISPAATTEFTHVCDLKFTALLCTINLNIHQKLVYFLQTDLSTSQMSAGDVGKKKKVTKENICLMQPWGLGSESIVTGIFILWLFLINFESGVHMLARLLMNKLKEKQLYS